MGSRPDNVTPLCRRRPRSAKHGFAAQKPITASARTSVAAKSNCKLRLIECIVGGDANAWSRIGVQCRSAEDVVLDQGLSFCHIEGVAICIDEHASGLSSCTFGDTSSALESSDVLVDGLSVRLATSQECDAVGANPDFLGIDHVVITTDDLTRTSTAIEHMLGVRCARVRDAGNSVTQSFHKFDNTILELVSGPQVTHAGARWWGFVLTVGDIDAWYTSVGEDVASVPRDAVQPGRRISTIRNSVGLGIPVAVMSPHIRA